MRLGMCCLNGINSESRAKVPVLRFRTAVRAWPNLDGRAFVVCRELDTWLLVNTRMFPSLRKFLDQDRERSIASMPPLRAGHVAAYGKTGDLQTWASALTTILPQAPQPSHAP